MKSNGDSYEVIPNTLGVKEIEAKHPAKDGLLLIKIIDSDVSVEKTYD